MGGVHLRPATCRGSLGEARGAPWAVLCPHAAERSAELASVPPAASLAHGRLSGVGPGLPGARPSGHTSRLFLPESGRLRATARPPVLASARRDAPPASVLDRTDPRVLSPSCGIELARIPGVPPASSAPVPIVPRDAAPRAACRLSGRKDAHAPGQLRGGRVPAGASRGQQRPAALSEGAAEKGLDGTADRGGGGLTEHKRSLATGKPDATPSPAGMGQRASAEGCGQPVGTPAGKRPVGHTPPPAGVPPATPDKGHEIRCH